MPKIVVGKIEELGFVIAAGTRPRVHRDPKLLAAATQQNLIVRGPARRFGPAIENATGHYGVLLQFQALVPRLT
jgi:hypothetical protein